LTNLNVWSHILR